jgi:1-acyl-sn-glycerol-3-phosphate acyltransferase
MLILMNHQSVLDIPLVFKVLQGGYPMVVTRQRYARGKPLISHMLRLYDFPLVDPTAPLPPQLEALERVARECRHPMVVYPEGTRTRNGEIAGFRPGGLRALLRARPWSVHIAVADGFWRAGKVVDFLENISDVRGGVTTLGPFAWTTPADDPEAFIKEMRERMSARLSAMRRANPDWPSSPALADLVAQWASRPLPEDAQRLVDALVMASGPSLRGVYFFGSRLVGTSPDAHSACDLVAVVTDPGAFYHALRAAGQLRGTPWVYTALNRWLTPNVISLASPDGSGPSGKCVVLTETDLLRATSAQARDHFVLGRFSQRVALAWAANDGARAQLLGILTTALRRSLEWAGPLVPAPFTAEGFARLAIAVSYAGEIRPESAGRATAVVDAQIDYLRQAVGQVLDDAVEAGILVRDGAAFAFARPPARKDVARVRRYFRRSKVRATLRWAKYIFTFDGWLEYIRHKAERRTGTTIVLSPLERRFPLIFLWPRLFRVLSSRRLTASEGDMAGSAGAADPAP